MEFLSVGFVLLFLLFYGFYSLIIAPSDYSKRIYLIALFNVLIYSTTSSLIYLICWSALLHYSARSKSLFKFGVYFAILQLLYWKCIEAKFIAYHPIVTPLGLSFFTFQGLSYLFATYGVSSKEEKIKPWSFLEVFAFTGFFPTIVAGPILRAPLWKSQISKVSNLTAVSYNAAIGSILAGCFYKMCLANYLYEYVSTSYADPENTQALTVLTGVIAYSFEIFFDFAGYSLIALGILKLMGLNFEPNFKSPYLSENLKEFWTKWHVSLSTWLKDYFYIAFLGGNKAGKWSQTKNAVIVMLVCGAWHGLAANFVVWGLLHALAIGFLNLKTKKEHKFLRPFNVLLTFTYVSFAWIFFRADSLNHAFSILTALFNMESWANFEWDAEMTIKSIFLLFCALVVMLEPTIIKLFNIVIKSKITQNPLVQVFAWSLLFIAILILSPAGMPPFIYAQF